MQKLLIFDEVYELMRTTKFKLGFYQTFDLMEPELVEKQIHFNDFLNSVTDFIDFDKVIQMKKDGRDKKYVLVKFEDKEHTSYIREKRLANYKLKDLYYDVCTVLNSCQEIIHANIDSFEEYLKNNNNELDLDFSGVSDLFMKNYQLLDKIKRTDLVDLDLKTENKDELINSLIKNK